MRGALMMPDGVARAAMAGVLLVSLAGAASAASAARVNIATVAGSINPASADYLIHSVAQSEREGVDALLVELDTPGGLVSSTKDIIQAFLNSTVPVIVYVAPRGAWAASAGMFITVSGHVAAMAPGTTIGAAHPVSALPTAPAPAAPAPRQSEPSEEGADSEEGSPAQERSGPRDHMGEKTENMLAAYAESIARQYGRNVDWVNDAVRDSVAIGEEEALELNVVDLVAQTRDELFELLEGREVEVAGETRTLSLSGARVAHLEMTMTQKLFSFLADPNLATILMMAAMLGLYMEFNNPGLIVPGVIGAVCGILWAISMQILPFSWIGVMVMLVGIALLTAEVFVPTFGALFAAGIACFLLGGTMVFDMPDASDLTVSFWKVLVPAVAAVALFGGAVVFLVGRSFFYPTVTGVDELIGLVGRSSSTLDPGGKVFVRGEYWDVIADQTVEEGMPVEVTAVEGMRLRVRRVRADA